MIMHVLIVLMSVMSKKALRPSMTPPTADTVLKEHSDEVVLKLNMLQAAGSEAHRVAHMDSDLL